jgi:hypothetical protein
MHQQYFWHHSPECREANKHHLLMFGFLLVVRQTLVSQLREDLPLCSSYLPLGVPNGLLLISHQWVIPKIMPQVIKEFSFFAEL